MNKSLSALDDKYGIPEESDDTFLTIKQGENINETQTIIDAIKDFFS